MDPVSFSDMLKQFGPYGICLFLMGSGLIYLMRWLREDRKQTDITHEGIRNQFLAALKDQRTETISALQTQRSEHTAALKEVTGDFKSAMQDHGRRIDTLAEKVDQIDEHVQSMKRQK